jgi:hypothetical protein
MPDDVDLRGLLGASDDSDRIAIFSLSLNNPLERSLN